MPPRSVRLAAVSVAACLWAGLAGCALWREAPVVEAPTRFGSHDFAGDPASARTLDDDILSPTVVGGDNGLELRWWVVNADRDEAFARAMAPYLAQPSPINAELARRWREHGLRMVRVPLGDIPGLRRAMPVMGRVDRQWLGQIPRWTELLQGDRITDATTLRVGRTRLPDTRGRMRLLGRAWTTPAPDGVCLRMDLTLQHAPLQRSMTFDALTGMRPAAPEDIGEIFTNLTANITLDPGYAYLIVPEDPLRDWTSAGALLSEAGSSWGTMRGVAPTEVAGPPAPLIPTPGEALLTSMPKRYGQPPLRAVVMLIPRLPERYLLMGPSSGQ